MVIKVFQKLVNNRLVDPLKKFELSCDFHSGFRTFRSIADLLTVASDRIARAFKKSGATQSVTLDISNAFYRILEFHVRYLALFCLFSDSGGSGWKVFRRIFS